MARDDFSARVKQQLALRVNYQCSNPDCQAPTSGAQSRPDASVNIGVAAHMTAASEGGGRFDSVLSAAERASAHNGIWLCQNCAKLVDNDEKRFPAALLRDWKANAAPYLGFGYGYGLGYTRYYHRFEPGYRPLYGPSSIRTREYGLSLRRNSAISRPK